MNKKTRIGAAIGSVLLGVGAASTAEAGALAQSIVLIDNFSVSNTSGVMDSSDFTTLNFTGTSGATSSLTGFADATASDNTSDGQQMDLYTSLGAGGPADNSFTQLTPPPTGSNFAIGDTYDFGSPITGLTGPLFSTDGTFPAGTQYYLGTAGYVSLTTDAVGSGDSNNSLEATVDFVVGQDGVLTFNFDASVFVQAFLDAGELPNSFASASGTITFSLVERATGAEVLDETSSAFINPLGEFIFGATRSSNAVGDGIAKTFTTGGFQSLSFMTDSLVAGTEYQLSARMNSNTDAILETVPEPEILTLMGLGLLGMTFRKKIS